MVPNNVKMLGISRAILENQLYFAAFYMERPGLSAQLLAALRLMVYKSMSSPYCEALNAGLLMSTGVPKDKIEVMKEDLKKPRFLTKNKHSWISA